MPCACRTSTLALFIRRVAHVDLEFSIWHSIDSQSLPLAKRKISTSRHLDVDRTTPSRNRIATSPLSSGSGETILDGQKFSAAVNQLEKQRGRRRDDALNERTNHQNWLINEARHKNALSAKDVESEVLPPRVGGRGAGDGVSNLPFHGAASPSGQEDKGEAGFFEITPETIDALAADSLRNTLHSRSRAAEPRHGNLRKLQRGTVPYLDSQYCAPASSLVFEGRALKNNKAVVNNSRMSGTTAKKLDDTVPEHVPWQIQKAALREKFKEGWSPRKRLSPDALAGIRAIHAQFPQQYTTSVLAEKFEVSPEAIRRILKSKWTPKEEEEADRQRRWFARGEMVWSRYAELGLKPPARWRKLGVGKREPSSSGRQRQSKMKTNITVRSAGDVVRLPHEEDRAASLAERIL
jgi:hypothetical protein